MKIALTGLAFAVLILATPQPGQAWKMSVVNRCTPVPNPFRGGSTPENLTATSLSFFFAPYTEAQNIPLLPGEAWTVETGWRCPHLVKTLQDNIYCSDLGIVLPCCWNVSWEFVDTSGSCRLRRR